MNERIEIQLESDGRWAWQYHAYRSVPMTEENSWQGVSVLGSKWYTTTLQTAFRAASNWSIEAGFKVRPLKVVGPNRLEFRLGRPR